MSINKTWLSREAQVLCTNRRFRLKMSKHKIIELWSLTKSGKTIEDVCQVLYRYTWSCANAWRKWQYVLQVWTEHEQWGLPGVEGTLKMLRPARGAPEPRAAAAATTLRAAAAETIEDGLYAVPSPACDKQWTEWELALFLRPNQA